MSARGGLSPTRHASRRATAALLAMLLAVLHPTASSATSEEVRDRLDAARERLDEIEATVESAVEDYNVAATRLARVEQQVRETRFSMSQVTLSVRVRRSTADGYVRGMYKRGPALEVATLMGAAGVGDAQARVTALRMLAERQLTTLEALVVDRKQLDVLGDRLTGQRERAASAATEAEQRRAHVERLLTEQEDEVSALREELREAEERARREAEERARRAAEERARQEAARRAAAAAQTRSTAPPAAEAPAPSSRPEPEPRSPSGGSAAEVAVDAALSQLGKPYRWGASGPDAYDCSGLTMWAWRQAGVSLPHSSRMQYAATRRVSRAELQPGDLVFRGTPIHHVSLYIGDGKVVDAPYSGQVVRIDDRMVNKSDVVGFGRP